ncbi:galactokinase [Salinibacterium sp. UTAS2018]|uniref:galactokinase n=1 Tax=Salinibacterium sp. UTAS2018 TaxID=2508880 RepID=UPI0010097999|nr:galactokinase [Salinibacterium sp. UTAS2018]QAV71486.1 galactokinase [Salinibacterium sp. UTAS2018]
MSTTIDELTARFTEFTGHAPEGVWSAPGRVNLIGEHTDYNEGFVLPFAIDRRTRAAVGLRTDGVIRVTSTFDNAAVEFPLAGLEAARTAGEIVGWSAYPLGVAWALGRHGADLSSVTGVDILIDSTVPVGAGLSSSAAIESSVALALNDLWNLGFTREKLAKVGQLAENEVVGAPTGIMDQSASLLGAADAAVFLDCRSLEAQVVPLGLAKAELSILVMDTRVSHSHATGGYSERRAACEAGAAAMGTSSLRDVSVGDLDRARELLDDVTFRRVRHVVTENQRVLDTVRVLGAEGPLAIGALLDASHISMRDDFEISTPELDLAVETARDNGAIGARMTGGGFGGAAIALVPHALVPTVEAAVVAAFDNAGYGEPATFTVTPSQGAERMNSTKTAPQYRTE